MTTINGRHGVFETLPGDSVVADSLRWYGEWAETELDLLRRFVPSGGVVADVGSFIGTHAIALARATGPLGRVLAFEPRRDTFAVLGRNIQRNALETIIEARNVGVSSQPGSIRLLDPEEGSQNLGSLALVDHHEGYEVALITLDMLELPRLDLIKIDVEGMEADVIHGARDTLQRCRPVVFAECNSVSGAASTLAASEQLGYRAFGAIYPAYNPDNINRCPDNFFGSNAECALFLVPEERVDDLPLQDMRPINILEDVVALLLEKPQYLPEMLPDAPKVEAVRRQAMHGTTEEAQVRPPLHVVVPFYRNEQLVAPLMRGLRNVASELAAARASVWFYNDSPGHDGLARALDDALQAGLEGVPLQGIANEDNLGFIGTCNRAFARAIAEGADVLLLNSDTEVMPGAISEMLAVAGLDPMFGFVCPRSNNATLASLPHSLEHQDVSAAEAFARFAPLARRLPRCTLAPTAIGFALWIRGTLLAEFGVFDTAYGKGYNEENDLIMRANRAGYRAVLANHAFVWHQGEQSFATTQQQRSERDAHNGALLRARYPEYPKLVERYYHSPEYRAETLLEALEPADAPRMIAFDFSSFGAFHNGTFESGVKLVAAALRSWPDDVRIGVIMSRQAWDFHGMPRLAGLTRLEPGQSNGQAAAVVRIGQPYQVDVLTRLFSTAPVVGIFMLDTISSDCGYLALDMDEDIWRFALENMSVLFTNSAFTLDRIRQRYAIGPHVMQSVSRHSLDPADYAAYDPAAAAGSHVLVIGNHYAHKFVKETADALASALPGRRIIAIGYPQEGERSKDIEAFQAGHIDDETFRAFYRDAELVVFPSHYEGFGFPVLHALAHHRPVFVRDTGLNRELAGQIATSANIHRYDTTGELVARLGTGIPAWSEERREGEADGWRRSALEVYDTLDEAMRRVDAQQIATTLRRLDGLAATLPPPSLRTSGQRAGVRLGHLIDRALRVPGMSRLARGLARLYRGARGR